MGIQAGEDKRLWETEAVPSSAAKYKLARGHQQPPPRWSLAILQGSSVSSDAPMHYIAQLL